MAIHRPHVPNPLPHVRAAALSLLLLAFLTAQGCSPSAPTQESLKTAVVAALDTLVADVSGGTTGRFSRVYGAPTGILGGQTRVLRQCRRAVR